MGRREKFLSEAVEQLRADGVTASFFAGDVRWALGSSSIDNCEIAVIADQLFYLFEKQVVTANVWTKSFCSTAQKKSL